MVGVGRICTKKLAQLMLPLVAIRRRRFFGLAAVGTFLSPWRHRTKLVLVWGSALAISTYTEVIRVVILPIHVVD